ncbi:MAG: SgcJ/EcaC family oxidoreductase [Pyrinomonadaceae bacterium]|nr:SgcJ/EcaC family oxidoreductase [Pyrinomonadaceae bacterium]
MSPYLRSRTSVAILIIGVFVASLMVATVYASAVPSVSTQSHLVGTRSAPEVARISELWAKEWSAKNLEAVIGLYAEDAVFLTATGSRVSGRTAIRDLFEKALAANTSDLRVHSKVTEQSGNLAYDSGEYEEAMTTGGVKRSGRGNYLVVFRRSGKNEWLIVEHMWTDAPTTGQ